MQLLTKEALTIGIPLFLFLILFIYLFIYQTVRFLKIHKRFKDVIDIEKEISKVNKSLKESSEEYETFKQQYTEKRSIYEKLLSEITILEEDLEYISYGIYKPHFDFDTSEKYKNKIKDIVADQKLLIRDKKAAVCKTDWVVGGSKREGQKMTNRNIKLMLRAFNNECDSSILKVKWNNVTKMEQRINKAFNTINKMGEPNSISIQQNYLSLKLKELYLAYEYQEKLYEEKEEQRRIREQMREEEKVQKEIVKAQREAEKEEERYQSALVKAKSDMGKAHGAQLDKLQEKLRLLEDKLKEAQNNKERALSRAQMTKSGHVYVISNIGSFGEDVYKIGMTRRLEPLDRVRELGDASVPFRFDVHAMIGNGNMKSP